MSGIIIIIKIYQQVSQTHSRVKWTRFIVCSPAHSSFWRLYWSLLSMSMTRWMCRLWATIWHVGAEHMMLFSKQTWPLVYTVWRPLSWKLSQWWWGDSRWPCWAGHYTVKSCLDMLRPVGRLHCIVEFCISFVISGSNWNIQHSFKLPSRSLNVSYSHPGPDQQAGQRPLMMEQQFSASRFLGPDSGYSSKLFQLNDS